MPTDRKGLRRLSIIIFAVGVLAGLLFFASLVWADYEASLFDPALSGDANLILHCPLILTSQETGNVSASFTNTATWKVNLPVRAHFSHDYLISLREENTVLTLDPGQSQEVRWTVTSEDLVYGRFIFVKVANSRRMPIPSRVGTCGFLVVDFPFLSGIEIAVLVIGLTLVCLVTGIVLWPVAAQPFTTSGSSVMRAMALLAAAIGTGLLCGVLGAWLAGVIVLVVSLLLIAEIGIDYANYN